jgi:AcrR family transcriptional regulator
MVDVEAEFERLVAGLSSLLRSQTSRRPGAGMGRGDPRPQGMVSPAMIHERALRLVDEEGARALTMRRLAHELQISTRTLYKRIGSRGALIRDVLRLHGSRLRLDFPDTGPLELRAWAWCVSLREALRAHPHLTELMQDDRTAMLQRTVGQLVEAAVLEGVSGDLAERFSWSLANVTVDDTLRELVNGPNMTWPPQPASDPLRTVHGLLGMSRRISRGHHAPGVELDEETSH